jgi:hypothetical protein
MTIFGLTLWRPWDWAILHGKDFENRSWAPPLTFGDYIALHAGQRWDAEGAEFIERVSGLAVPDAETWPGGQIVGVAKFVGTTRDGEGSPWFFGPWGWKLHGAIAIRPVPCRGAQKLWRLPDDVLAQVRQNWLAAVAEGQRKELGL